MTVTIVVEVENGEGCALIREIDGKPYNNEYQEMGVRRGFFVSNSEGHMAAYLLNKIAANWSKTGFAE